MSPSDEQRRVFDCPVGVSLRLVLSVSDRKLSLPPVTAAAPITSRPGRGWNVVIAISRSGVAISWGRIVVERSRSGVAVAIR